MKKSIQQSLLMMAMLFTAGMLQTVQADDAATRQASTPQKDQAESEAPMVSLFANADGDKTTVVAPGESVAQTVMLALGEAPYELVWTDGRHATLRTETVSEMPEDLLVFTFEPEQTTDYVLTVTDALQRHASDTIRVVVTGAARMADFEDLWYDSDEDGEYDYMFGPFWMNTVTETWGALNYSGTFLSGSYAFTNNCIPYWGSFDGFAYSRSTSASFSAATFASDQFNAVTGGDYDGSGSFAVGYVGYGSQPTVEVLNDVDGDVVKGFYVTNSAYTADAIVNGDGQQNVKDANGNDCASDEGFHQGDYVLLTVTGYDKSGVQTGTVDFYLADYRSAESSEWYYVRDWQWVSLTSLGTVKRITFSMSATRSNNWGTTTPTYFCMDNFNDPKGVATGIGRAVRPAAAAESDVQHFNVAGQRVGKSVRGLNIVRQNGAVRKVLGK